MATLKLEIYYASWCPICEEKVLEAREEFFSDVAVHEIDIDEEPDRALAVELKGVPLFVLYVNDEVVGSKIGAISMDYLKEWIDGYN